MPKIKCPKCNSTRIKGNRNRFRCEKCGFIHDINFKVIREVTNGGITGKD